ncbi:hypothetical protein [Pseudaestuariivita sp.]|uniref:hypothetical protein n=1 Tax=Pseudaestuariivita sp. TaxID=2211669 RepID=UPI0040593614
MEHPFFAIATANELEAVDLSDILSENHGFNSHRVMLSAPLAAPQGLPSDGLPRAIFIGLPRPDPRAKMLRIWAEEKGVPVITINGGDPHSKEPLLARPFVEADVARLLDDLP